MLLRNQRAEIGGLLQWRTDSQTFRLVLQSADKPVKDGSLHVNPLRAEADLSRVKKRCVTDPVDGLFEIAIAEHDRRVLSAKLERNRLDRRRDGRHDCGSGL